MTTFIAGPADKITLALRRSPMFLRVVRDTETGNVDALDQLSDKPEPGEEVFVYIQTERHGMVHINARDKKGRRCGGFFPMAKYKLLEPQPDQATVRGPLWPAWATKMAEQVSTAK